MSHLPPILCDLLYRLQANSAVCGVLYHSTHCTWDCSFLISHSDFFLGPSFESFPLAPPAPQLRQPLSPLTVLLTNMINFRSCATLTAFNHWEKTGNVLILYLSTLPPRLPRVPLPLTLISPGVSSASIRCIERRCACVGGAGGALHCSAHWFRWTSPNNGAR